MQRRKLSFDRTGENGSIYYDNPFQAILAKGKCKAFLQKYFKTNAITYPNQIEAKGNKYRIMSTDEEILMKMANRLYQEEKSETTICTIQAHNIFFQFAELKIAIHQYAGIEGIAVDELDFQSHGARLDNHDREINAMQLEICKLKAMVCEMEDGPKKQTILERIENLEKLFTEMNKRLVRLEKNYKMLDEQSNNATDGKKQAESTSEPMPPSQTVETPSSCPYDNQMEEKKYEQHTVAIRGLKYIPIPAQGHCFFLAVGRYLNLDISENELNRYLRNQAADYIAQHSETFQTDIQHSQPNRTLYQYLEGIRHGSDWGGFPEIISLQKIYDRPIIIMQPNDKPMIFDDPNKYTGDPIFIYYKKGTQSTADHYDALDIEAGFTATQILNEIQRLNDTQSKVVFMPPSAVPINKANNVTRISDHSSSLFTTFRLKNDAVPSEYSPSEIKSVGATL